MHTQNGVSITLTFDKSKLIKGEEIPKAIGKFVTSMKGVDEHIHLLACSALQHAVTTGDTIYCTMLVQAMPKFGRGTSLKDWFIKYAGCIQWLTKDGESKFKKIDGKEYSQVLAETGYEKPFYNKPEKGGSDFDLKKLLKVLDSASKRAEKGIEGGSLKVDQNVLAEVNGKAAHLLRVLSTPKSA